MVSAATLGLCEEASTGIFVSFPQGVQRKSSDFIFGRTGILLCLLIRVISELSYEDAKWLF